MKHLRLLIAAGALILGVNAASAQKDVTSQYIKNATLSSLDGWTNVNFNTPVNGLHQNVNNDGKYSNATAGYATECYEGWSSVEKSEYSLTQKITLPAGHYTLVNYSFFRHGQSYNTDASKSLAYLKAGEAQVPVKTLGSIQASGYANSQWEAAGCFDAKMYRNAVDFEIVADGTEIEIGVYGTFDTSITKSWIICGMFELIDNDQLATMESPFDVTGFITNPGFEYRDMTGWTLSEDGAFGVQNNNQGFKTAWYYGEKWQSSGALAARSMSQTISDLPAGYYKLTVNMGGNGTYVDLNGKTVNWTEDKDYTVGYVLAENENLTITAGKTAEGTANWIHFDNFRLQFCGDVQAALTTLLGQVSGYEGIIPTAAYAALQTDVAAYNQTYTDVDDLLAAIAAVQALYEGADLLKAPYATAKTLLEQAAALVTNYNNMKTLLQNTTLYLETLTSADDINTLNNKLTKAIPVFQSWLDMKAAAEALAAVDNDNADANTALTGAIAAQEANVQAVSAIDADGLLTVNTAITTVKAAMVTYVGAANPTVGNKFDCTFLIATPDMTNLWTGAWHVVPDGWATEQEGGNFQVMQNSNVDAEDGIHKVFTEYYYLNNNTTWGNNKFNVYTTANLPIGTFTMSCYAFAKEENYSSGAPNPQVFFYANDTQGSLVSSAKLTEQSISFINDEAQDVKIGLKPLAGNTYNWMGIGYVKLYKEYTDNTTYAINTATTNATVAVTVDNVAATSAKALKTVTLTITPDAGYAVYSVTATYNNGTEDVNLDVANPSKNVYTYQQPAFDVNVEIVAMPFASVELSIPQGIQFATRIFPFVPTLPAGVEAYSCDGLNAASDALVLTKVDTPEANKPYILFAENEVSSTTLEGWSTAEEDAYTVGALTGVYKATAAPVGSFVLQDGTEGIGFYKVESGFEPTVNAYRCYVTAPVASSRLGVVFDGETTTAINAINALTSGQVEIFNAAGARIPALQKGMNIIRKADGTTQKVLVK